MQHCLSEVSPHLTLFSIAQLASSNIIRPQSDTLHLVSPSILQLHPPPQPQGEADTRNITSRSCINRRQILWRVLLSKGRSGDDASKVAESDHEAGRSSASVLVEIVVVVPRVYETGMYVRACT